ncbi:MAG: sodium:alanine symporter family protein [Oscillospiraceae bacterium]|nr:sodium:alanine symporter family protein [Oscillospiraceae bacterium]
MTKFLTRVHSLLWGAPALVLILGVGIFLTVRTGFAQVTLFPRALRDFLRKLRGKDGGGEGVSPFQALCTALAATVGTGNLVGVAGAICLGGPGAIFWMWICGLLGMVTKFAEVTLAVRYRTRVKGEYLGGPMYMISRGMGEKWRWLASLYSFFGVAAAFGVGNATQVNAVITGINAVLSREASLSRNLLLGLILAVLIGAVLLGGAKRIGRAAEFLVPFVSGAYILLCMAVLAARHEAVPGAFGAIFRGAFSPRAVTGGMLGSAFQALKVGCSRGVFTNEAGMGTASIAHASANTSHPAEQGLMGIMEVFLDTILICTLTALVILVSGIPIPYGEDLGGKLTMDAFTAVCGGWVSLFLAAALCCFAFATVLGWGLYGARCAQFLFGGNAWNAFALLQTVTVVLGAVLNTETVWLLAETVNGLMAIPNLIALAALSPELRRLTIEFKEKPDGTAVSGGNYADFHQRQPL